MQKTLEILKSEDGLTICKLSHKKWLFKYKIPIRTEEGEIIRYINGKMRYLINEEKDVYLPLNPNIKLTRLISVSLGVKMEQIAIHGRNEIHLDKKFSLITGFLILDKQWIRDFKIKKLTDEIIDN